jgi:DNA-directed RNA polymerase subunit RPC12/RpoP
MGSDTLPEKWEKPRTWGACGVSVFWGALGSLKSGPRQGRFTEGRLMTNDPQECARCGAEIPAERIEALPDTRVCIRCSQEMGGEFDVYVVPERTSKDGSLKKNYGSYSSQKVRKPIRPKE